jgi:hypothetical protein
MEQKELNYFERLYSTDVKDKVKQKNGLSYVSWAGAWAEVKKLFPDANYIIYENENSRPWFDDGKTAWVKTGVTVNDIEHIEYLPVMDFKNKSISADAVTSMDANKAIQRSITKACARHGIGLHLYIGFEDTEENLQLFKLRDECMELIKKKSALSEDAKAKVADVCKSADDNANGDPRLIEDVDILETLKKQLLAIRK